MSTRASARFVDPFLAQTRGSSPSACRRLVTRLGYSVALFALAALPSAARGQTGADRTTATTAAEAVTLSPGDVLRITVWRKPELSGEFTIAGNGTIIHPLYRDVRVVGIPMADVETLIRGVIGKIETAPFVIEPLLRVSVEGEVRLPSVYSLRPETSVAQAIALAGGPTLDARVDRVRLIRTGGEISVDLRQASAGATRTTIRSGDRIVIERNRAIFRDIVTPAVMILGATAAVASVILYNRHP